MSEWIKRLAERYSEVNEKKLTGNQHKLDMDKDGDIDGDDFKQMRSKKKTNEDEVVMNPKKEKKEKETMAAEAKVDEISMDKAKSAYYKRKSKAQAAAHQGSKDYAKDQMAKARKTKAYIDKREEAELDEVSMDTAKSAYLKRKTRAQDAASRGSMDYAKSQMAKARKTKAYMDKRESVEESIDFDYHRKAIDDHKKKLKLKNNRWQKGAEEHDQAAKAHQHVLDMYGKFGGKHSGTQDAIKSAKRFSDKAHKASGMKESALPPVYARIMEERAKHYKSATKPEDWDEKEKNNKGAMDMKKDMAVDTSDKISNYDDLGHDDASKAGRVTKSAKTRPGDNAAGDKNVINPVKK